MLHGRLLAESMKVGRDLQVAGLRLTHLGRHDVSGSVSATQAGVWTFVDYEPPDEVADELARQLARIFVPEDGWYADSRSVTTTSSCSPTPSSATARVTPQPCSEPSTMGWRPALQRTSSTGGSERLLA